MIQIYKKQKQHFSNRIHNLVNTTDTAVLWGTFFLGEIS